MTYFPRHIKIQWHLTDRCNFRCTHCYQHAYTDGGLPWKHLLHILYQVLAFRRQAAHYHQQHIPLHLTLTGGEPFLKPELNNLLAAIAQQAPDARVGILSNGSAVIRSQAHIWNHPLVEYVQLSLEGGPATNDAIRGKGTFAEITQTSKLLARAGVPVVVSFTAHAGNYHEFPQVAKAARQMKAHRLWADRYLPLHPKDTQLMNTRQTRELFNLMQKEQDKNRWWPRKRTTIARSRALQFLVGGGSPYRCTAGDSLLAILPDGQLLPCRRMPEKLGNLLTDNLGPLYQQHPFLQKLRHHESATAACAGCYYQHYCQGGLKCLSYALTGNPHSKDPNCWL